MEDSKSTDKLAIMQDIIETTLNSLSEERKDQIESISITWTEFEDVVVPNLNINFFE